MSKEINFSAWQNKGMLYRLEGVRYPNGTASLQDRPNAPIVEDENNTNGNKSKIIYMATKSSPAMAAD